MPMRTRTRKTGDGTAGKAQPRAWEIDPEAIPVALSYDDVLLVPRRTTVGSRRTVDISTNLSRNVRLNMPIVSANMDTVTECAMAIEMARHGGIGIIHRFLTVEAQAEEVRKVKRAESFVISQPYTIGPDETVEQRAVSYGASRHHRAGGHGRAGQADRPTIGA